MRALFDFAIRGNMLSVVTNSSGGHKVAILPPAPARRTPAATDVMPGGIYSSCGTILAIVYSGPPAWDVLRGRPFYASRLKRPVCSDNLSVIAGLGEGKTGLVIEPGGTRLPYEGPSSGFGISPNGIYLAYYQYTEKPPALYDICVKHAPDGVTSCRPLRGDLMGYKTVLAVSDSGEVAFVQGRETNQHCYYYGDNESVRHSPPGQESECAGIFIASQSSPPKLAIPDGFSPQWVTRSNVDGLIAALSRRRK